MLYRNIDKHTVVKTRIVTTIEQSLYNSEKAR